MAGSAPTILEDLAGLAGQEVSVPCSVDVATCGDFHSVKWYRETQRVFVYSELANLERSEGSLANRYQICILFLNFQILIFVATAIHGRPSAVLDISEK